MVLFNSIVIIPGIILIVSKPSNVIIRAQPNPRRISEPYLSKEYYICKNERPVYHEASKNQYCTDPKSDPKFIELAADAFRTIYKFGQKYVFETFVFFKIIF